MADKIIVFDTTLRDGDQASGFHLLKTEKIKLAKALAKLGVDVIEAGFPASSQGDFEAVFEIAKAFGTKDSPIICSLARAVDSDIVLAAKAIEPAYNKRIHTFIATSDIHINHKFKKDRGWIIEKAINAVKKAKEFVEDVEFSCEDFGRTDTDYIIEVVEAAINAGAKTINLPDTVGWLTPNEAYSKVKYVIDTIRKKGLDAIFSVHNHNDFGMATATTIEAVRAGARQVEVTMNGIGERAGNTSLEEVVAILKTKKIAETNIKTEYIGQTSKLLSELTGIYPQPNKAIVGRNAFAHEAGIHQDGIIKGRSTYETMDPNVYGVESILTFGPRSGRNALKEKLKIIKITLSEEEFEKTVKKFKEITDNKKEVDDADLILAAKGESKIPVHYNFIAYDPKNNGGIFNSAVEIEIEGIKKRLDENGDGIIDASIKAIIKMTDLNLNLKDFSSKSEGLGSDSQAKTRIVAAKNSWEVKGYGKDFDVVTSAIKAYLDAMNRLKYIEDYFKK